MSKPYTPRPYQTIITDHILDTPRCAVWASMGLGKTVGTLTALDVLLAAGEDDPVLVIAPLRVARKVWPNEIRKWDHLSHLQIMPIVGSEDERRRALSLKAHIYTVNYDNPVWLVDYFGDRWPFTTSISAQSSPLEGFPLRHGTARPPGPAPIAHNNHNRF